ncbi:MAG: hypothetical protein LBG60_14675 [Bifidobacteriaceae bacterium]|nr:hypothetical protein [Bifidobacteriaceae bacterium]
MTVLIAWPKAEDKNHRTITLERWISGANSVVADNPVAVRPSPPRAPAAGQARPGGRSRW